MNTSAQDQFSGQNIVDAAIRIALLGIMAVASLRIIQPFIMPAVWGIIIAVAVHPFVEMLAKRLGGRKKISAIIFALVAIAALVVPTFMLLSSSVNAVQELSEQLENDVLRVPPPPPGVADWPVIGTPVNATWNLASTNLDAVITKYSPQLREASTTLLAKAGGSAKGLFMFIISIMIATALLITGEGGVRAINKIITRFAGEKGPELVTLATATIRGVMQGVIGVAVIQSVLSVIGMLLVGVPAAGLWAVLVLILAIIQLPPILILGPVAAWVFTFADQVPAILFLIWALVVSGCDGFLKPVLMGRGVDAPMLVILLGALGGMMLSGIIGLFVGAVILAISFTLFMAWVDESETEKTDAGSSETA
ncbi:AI-2E family transporter [Desulfosediminicola flagellatus]|uniref:AI-2E family transporter n=1 Tax=Desulfosediminicola flagellatus TaxID=2569541 RepID=UPI0010ABF75E|nr:AI-2E family transporter [Desulfosediminicola flagellatus]